MCACSPSLVDDSFLPIHRTQRRSLHRYTFPPEFLRLVAELEDFSLLKVHLMFTSRPSSILTTASRAMSVALAFVLLGGCGDNAVAPVAAPVAVAPVATPKVQQPATPAVAPPVTDVSGAVTDVAAVAQEAEDLPPPIELDPPVLDFGVLSPTDVAESVVKLRNTGTTELEVLSVQPSCKCTTIDDITGQKIPVGGFIELKAKMKPTSGAGDKKAEIKVLIDGYSRIVSIQLKSEVSMPVRVRPYYMNIVTGQAQNGRTVIESIDGRPFKICAIGGYAPRFVGFDPTKEEPANHYVVEWDVARDFPSGKFPRYLIVETDHPDCPIVDVFVRHETTMPKIAIALSDYRHTFDRLEAGKSVEFTVTCTKLEADEPIIAASAGSTDLKVELVSQVREGTDTIVTLRATSMSSTRGLVYVNASIYSPKRQQDFELWGQVVDPGFTGCFPCKERAEITPAVGSPKPIRGTPGITKPVTSSSGSTPSLAPSAPVGVK